mmetsp:Transcript_29608/g.64379  ORF Transcript_29608/g.64379 Transcript_29608/m.64379 type:complete len:257 (-) Transcript_29608:1203-1973(-)
MRQKFASNQTSMTGSNGRCESNGHCFDLDLVPFLARSGRRLESDGSPTRQLLQIRHLVRLPHPQEETQVFFAVLYSSLATSRIVKDALISQTGTQALGQALAASANFRMQAPGSLDCRDAVALRRRMLLGIGTRSLKIDIRAEEAEQLQRHKDDGGGDGCPDGHGENLGEVGGQQLAPNALPAVASRLICHARPVAPAIDVVETLAVVEQCCCQNTPGSANPVNGERVHGIIDLDLLQAIGRDRVQDRSDSTDRHG